MLKSAFLEETTSLHFITKCTRRWSWTRVNFCLCLFFLQQIRFLTLHNFSNYEFSKTFQIATDIWSQYENTISWNYSLIEVLEYCSFFYKLAIFPCKNMYYKLTFNCLFECNGHVEPTVVKILTVFAFCKHMFGRFFYKLVVLAHLCYFQRKDPGNE